MGHAVEPVDGGLRLVDDGPGIDPVRLQALQQALDTQAYEGRTGLGLMLADLVARAHGGRLRLGPSPYGSGLAVTLTLSEPADQRDDGAVAAGSGPNSAGTQR